MEEPPITPVMTSFPPEYALPPTGHGSVFLQPMATPHGRASFPFSDLERRSYVADQIGRPQFKIRHSASTLVSLRQQELQQPSWFETNFTILRSLGSGAFSEAFEVADRSRHGEVYAVKRTKSPFGGPKDR